MRELVFTDRYKAFGVPYPDPRTMCQGQCEGMGFYPQFCVDGQAHLMGRAQPVDGPTQYELDAWRAEHDKAHTIRRRLWNAVRFRDLSYLWKRCDGYHFIVCPDCNGTGKRV